MRLSHEPARKKRAAAYAKQLQWQTWFAWYPVTFYASDAEGLITVWMEKIERKRMSGYYSDCWTYRLKE